MNENSDQESNETPLEKAVSNLPQTAGVSVPVGFAPRGGYPALAWTAQPTRSGWWWWEKSESPIFVEPITNGRREDLGLGTDLPKFGIQLCSNMEGRWAGPLERPSASNEPTTDNIGDQPPAGAN